MAQVRVYYVCINHREEVVQGSCDEPCYCPQCGAVMLTRVIIIGKDEEHADSAEPDYPGRGVQPHASSVTFAKLPRSQHARAAWKPTTGAAQPQARFITPFRLPA
jgi:hypothetical protein